MPFDLLQNEPWRGVRDQALSNLTGVEGCISGKGGGVGGWRGAFLSTPVLLSLGCSDARYLMMIIISSGCGDVCQGVVSSVEWFSL